LAAGSYEVYMTANGYAPSAPRTLTVTNGAATESTFELTPLDRQFGYRVIMNFNPGDKTLEKVNIQEMIGAADGRTYPIGSGGFAVIDFGDSVKNITGVDFAVRAGNGLPEGYSVEVAKDWTGPWTAIDTVYGSAAFDLSVKSVDWFRYLKIRDDGDGDTLDPDAGLNIDAVEYFKVQDLSAPSAPSAFTAAAAGFDRVNLSWNRSSDSESDIATYEILRDDAVIAEYRDSLFSDYSLLSGTTYRYKLRAKNSRGVYSPYVEVSVTTPKDTTAPKLLYAYVKDSAAIVLRFSKQLDSASAVNLSNYSVSGGVTLQGATLLNGSMGIVLSTSLLKAETEYNVDVTSVKDRMVPPNIASGLSGSAVYMPGLVGMWRFGTVNGDTVYDESGKDHHGALLAGAKCASDAGRAALTLDGVDDGMVVANSSSLNFARKDFTIACRIYADTLRTKMALVEKAYNSLGFRFLTSDLDADRIRFVRGTTFTTGVQSNDLSLAKRKWIHIAAVIDSGIVTMYVDGAVSGSGPLAAVDASSSSDLYVGIKGFASSSVIPFKGKIDDLYIFDRAIGQQTIIALAAGSDTGHVGSEFVAIEDGSEGVTVSPNPFNPSASIYVKAAAGFAGKITIYDINGNKVIELHNGAFQQGLNRFVWDGRDHAGRMVSSGVYLLNVFGSGKTFRKGIILSR
ncbi:MAG: T9SS type A sorting domain-containing protein, partial [Fibrobacteres bacterium]|nr:T9SS type A sorting domain-containing protein [Fibrobacterota bacterium]